MKWLWRIQSWFETAALGFQRSVSCLGDVIEIKRAKKCPGHVTRHGPPIGGNPRNAV